MRKAAFRRQNLARSLQKALTHVAGFGLLWLLLPAMVAAGQSAKQGATAGVAGNWAGKLSVGQASLRIWLEVTADSAGKLSAKLISLDQGATPIPCADVELSGKTFSFNVPAVKGSYSGTLSADGKAIDGTWTQGRPLPLVLTRQPKGARPAVAQGAKPAPAKPPVPLDKLQSVLNAEFAPVLAHGTLAKAPGTGVVIGVMEQGQRRIFAYGAVKPDSIFEIGSVTKTFTGLLLAQMIEQKKVTLDEPVRGLLPPGTVAKPAGPEITLLDLATQHSGLPRLPTNLHPEKNPTNPYSDYHAAELYEFLKSHGVALPAKAKYLYSNLGYGLLGFVLARRAGVSYGQLVRTEITGPLRMNDTAVTLSPAQKKLFVAGHNAAGATVPGWTLASLEGAGALRSNAGDLLTYAEAQLHPDSVVAHAAANSPGETLASAIAMTHKLRADGPPGMKVGLGWVYGEREKVYWHDGGTGGYTSFVAFQPANDRAVVVLYNREDIGSTAMPFSDRVAANVIALISGTPAVPLQ